MNCVMWVNIQGPGQAVCPMAKIPLKIQLKIFLTKLKDFITCLLQGNFFTANMKIEKKMLSQLKIYFLQANFRNKRVC